VRQLDAGRPLRATGCGRLALPAGSQRVRAPAATLRPDRLLLTSPAPNPVAHISATAGAALNPGKPGRGKRDGVKLDVRAPGWLVLGESYDRGWRAWCGGKALGAPVPLDGYANAWPVEPGCAGARFAFAPQGPVHLIQLLSAFACLVLLLIALAPRHRRRRANAPAVAAADWPDPPPVRLPVRTAAMAGLLVGGALAFCFSLRSGLLIAPATALVLWRGIPSKPLALAGGALLAVAVPLIYIAFPADDLGGFNPSYAGDNLGGHWVAVAAWVLLALALWRVLSTASRGAARARRSAP
jgi:arabinofuranan 3-O-arabinosyltransferase